MSVRDMIPWNRGGRRSSVPARRESGHPMFALQSDINRALEDFLRGFDTPLGGLSADFSDEDVPRVDVRETDKEIDVIAELPGMDEDDVEVSVADGALVIRGEKEAEEEKQDEGYLLRERRFGYFERTVPLPENLDIEKADATFKNGVLTVRLPKRAGESSGRKRVTIQRDEREGREGRETREARGGR